MSAKKIENEELTWLAQEARLSFSEKELADASAYINNFLEMLDRFKELDLKDVEPFSFAEAIECPLREDVVVKFENRDAIMAESAHVEGDYFKAPRIMEGV